MTENPQVWSHEKNALITGANKGIGFEVARQLGEHGMTVLLGSRDPGRGEEATAALRSGGLDAYAVELDVSDDASIGAAATRITTEFGHLDVLVNNAGTAGDAGANTAPSATTRAALHQIFETNVFGLVAVTNAVLPLLRLSDSPRMNASIPGYVQTDMNDGAGMVSAAEGAAAAVALALTPDNGPNGEYRGALFANEPGDLTVAPW